MKRKRFGFTLIEVALFLAITGLLFMGIIMGTGNSIAQQRFFDSTQSFAEFLRSVYSQVSNPQSVGDGRGELAIYGKLISFGQCLDIDLTTSLCDGSRNITRQKVFVYDVVGDVAGKGSGDAVSMLQSVGANVVVFRKDGAILDPIRDNLSRADGAEYAGLVESYEPHWEATVETTTVGEGQSNLYKGTILIVRHPTSGTINTLIYNDTLQINEEVHYVNDVSHDYDGLKYLLMGDPDHRRNFVTDEIDFCINPDGLDNESERRWDVRLVKNARNSSGVEVIELDNEGETPEDNSRNKCRF